MRNENIDTYPFPRKRFPDSLRDKEPMSSDKGDKRRHARGAKWGEPDILWLAGEIGGVNDQTERLAYTASRSCESMLILPDRFSSYK